MIEVAAHDRATLPSVISAPPIELACIDLAGTTVADDGAVEAAFLEAMGIVSGTGTGRQPFDLDAALDVVRATMGQSKIDVFQLLLGDHTAAIAANTAFESAFADQIGRGGIDPLPGAAAAVASLGDHGIKVCFTTGFSPETRDRLLQSIGWMNLADLALSPADAAGRGRPDPAMILTAVVALGVGDVRAVAVVGDTTSDLLAGTRAGASIVAGVLTGAHDRATLATVAHTHIVDTVADFADLALATRQS